MTMIAYDCLSSFCGNPEPLQKAWPPGHICMRTARELRNLVCPSHRHRRTARFENQCDRLSSYARGEALQRQVLHAY